MHLHSIAEIVFAHLPVWASAHLELTLDFHHLLSFTITLSLYCQSLSQCLGVLSDRRHSLKTLRKRQVSKRSLSVITCEQTEMKYKEVLLRERKRYTNRTASARHAVPVRGTPFLSNRGYPHPSQWGGTPSFLMGGTPILCDVGVPPSRSWWEGGTPLQTWKGGYSIQTWEGVPPIGQMGVPPPTSVDRQTFPSINITFPHTLYADSNNADDLCVSPTFTNTDSVHTAYPWWGNAENSSQGVTTVNVIVFHLNWITCNKQPINH